jgi:hypothetical protein
VVNNTKHFVGARMLAPGAVREERVAAWKAYDESVSKWHDKLAAGARDGFDKQEVACAAALADVLA